MLGDRRGWLLLALQVVAVIGVGLLAAVLIDGTRWLIVFPPLALLVVIWIGQAISAYHLALRRGGSRGGELSITLLLPLGVGLLTLFWLFGGRHGSPSATLEAYISAWMNDRPDIAAALFTGSPSAAEVSAEWDTERGSIVGRIRDGQLVYGEESGLDPERPFDSLRFTESASGVGVDGRLPMVVEIVRSRAVEATVLGFIPTASQETVVVEQAAVIWLTLEPEREPDWLPSLGAQSYAWKISSIEAVDQTP